MKYYKIQVKEKHEHPNPMDLIYIYGEIDDDLWETRRVEIYKDGSYRYTDGEKKVGEICLAENKADDELLNVNADDEQAYIHIDYIAKDEFEKMWELSKRYAEDNGIAETDYR